MPSMTDQHQLPLACSQWCVVPADEHEREWLDYEGAVHWSESPATAADWRPRVAVSTDMQGRVKTDGGPEIFLGDYALTPAGATTLAQQLLDAAAMCAQVTS